MSDPLSAGPAALVEHLRPMLDASDVMSFVVEHDGRPVGRTNYYGLVPGLCTEVGNTFHSRDVWGTHVNPTCKLLLFSHAFETLGLERVALRCDHRNIRSHRAIARLGAIFEGTLRRFRPAADVEYFSIVREEWPGVRDGLLARLAQHTRHGQDEPAERDEPAEQGGRPDRTGRPDGSCA